MLAVIKKSITKTDSQPSLCGEGWAQTMEPMTDAALLHCTVWGHRHLLDEDGPGPDLLCGQSKASLISVKRFKASVPKAPDVSTGSSCVLCVNV